jgi:hypothetical protein
VIWLPRSSICSPRNLSVLKSALIIAFVRYAARYVRRPPIASWRLLKVTNREVEFVAKDTKAKRLVWTRCQLTEFVRLLAQHVPDNHRKMIRYFGLWAPSAKGQTYDALLLLLGETPFHSD